MAEAIKSITVKFNFTRLKGLIVLLIVLALACLIMLYRYGYFGVLYQKCFGAEVTITITDTENKGLPASVAITNIKKSKYNSSLTANESGQIQITKLISGQYQINITDAGYTSRSENFKLKRGKNSFSYQLEKIPAKKITINGIVQNYINEQVISGAKVTVEGQTATTDESGKYTFENITTVEQEFVIEKSGYITNTKKVVVVATEIEKLNLTPTGRIVYVSNKDQGKRGLFTVNYDGSDSKSLVKRAGEYEDYDPVFSPDKNKVTFSSTREGGKDGSSPRVDQFIVDITGKNLNKICEKCSKNFWTVNSKNVIWQSTKNNEAGQNISELYMYKVASNQSVLITSQTSYYVGAVVNNDSSTKIAYSINGGTPAKYELYIYDIASETSSKVMDGTTYISIMKFTSDNELLYSMYDTAVGQTKYYNFKLSDNTSTATEFQYPNRYPVKSPDSKKLAYAETRDGKTNVYLADNDKGLNEKKLTSIDISISNIYWSYDGKYIIFDAYKTGESSAYVVGIDGGSAKKIVDIAVNLERM